MICKYKGNPIPKTFSEWQNSGVSEMYRPHLTGWLDSDIEEVRFIGPAYWDIPQEPCRCVNCRDHPERVPLPASPYALFAVRSKNDDWFFCAGCRTFSLADALAHWGDPEHPNPVRSALFVAAIKAFVMKGTEEEIG